MTNADAEPIGKETDIAVMVIQGDNMTLLDRIFEKVMSRKCKFYDVCKLRNPESVTCTKDRGQYYEIGKHPGCYRRLEEMRQNGRDRSRG